MKCPKCGYLGFERVQQCRNCGYDFSLTSARSTPDAPDLPLRDAPEPLEPLDDLSFLDAVANHEPIRPFANPTAEPQVVIAAEPTATSSSDELPLFGRPIPEDLPLITKPSPPRQPLAVRRATPEVPRLRSVLPRAPMLDLGIDPSSVERAPIEKSLDTGAGADLGNAENAGVGVRFAAVLVDALILAAIDAVVVYFTMQICGIGIGDLTILPRVPLLAFLLVQNGGYLVVFTAGGQTLGKMAAGIKVVSAERRSSVDLGCAFIRELAWFVLAVPAGLGLLTVLSRDRRGLHDRFAGTRVVRA